MPARLVLCLSVALGVGAARAQPVPDAAVAAALASVEGTADVTSAHVSDRSGVAYVYLRRTLDGLPVRGADQTVAVGPGGRVLHRAGALGPAAPPETSGPAVGRPAAGPPPVDRADAVRLALRALGAGSLRTPATAQLVWSPGLDGALRLVWETVVWPDSADVPWQVLIDATTGEATGIEALGHACFSPPSEPQALGAVGPAGSTLRTETLRTETLRTETRRADPPLLAFALPAVSPDDGVRTLLDDPADRRVSRGGWAPARDGDEWALRGVNVEARLYRDGARVPVRSVDGAFSFPLDLAEPAWNHGPASATNAYYLANRAHDLFAHYGFTQEAGNYEGNDPVVIDVQDAGGPGAFFVPNVDGTKGSMSLRVWGATEPGRDAALDASVVIHEYAHGLTSRLVGGAARVGCVTNGETLAEGWSDWYALMTTMRDGDDRSTPRGIAGYLMGEAEGGTVRTAPYTADFEVSPWTYADTRGTDDVYDLALVWATVLWDVTWDLIDAHGFNPDLADADGGAGNQIALSLVTEALKLQPCRGGFVDGRNAILAADRILYGGAHRDLLWEAFRRRGLGGSAQQGSPELNADNEAAFDPPAPPRLELVADTVRVPQGSADGAVLVTNAGGEPLVVQAGAPSAPWLTALWDEAVVDVGATLALPFRVDTTSRPLGLSEAALPVETNDPDRSSATLSVEVYNSGAAALAVGWPVSAWRLFGAPFEGITPRALDAVTPLAGFPWSDEGPVRFELVGLQETGAYGRVRDGDRPFDAGEPLLWRAGSSSLDAPLWLRPPFGTPLSDALPDRAPIYGTPLGLFAPPSLAPLALDSLGSRIDGASGTVTAQVWNGADRSFEVAGARSTWLQPWEVAAVEVGEGAAVHTTGGAEEGLWPGVVELEVQGGLGTRDRALVVALGREASAPKLRPFQVPYVAGAFVDSSRARPLRAAVSHDPADGPAAFDIVLDGSGRGPGGLVFFGVSLGPHTRLPDSLAVYLHDLVTGELVDLRETDGLTLQQPGGDDWRANLDAVLPPAFLDVATPPRLRLHILPAGAPLPCSGSGCVVASGAGPDARPSGLGPPRPNPARGSVTVTVRDVRADRLSLLDVTGREVRVLAVPADSSGEVRVHLDGLAPGVYVVRLASGAEVWTQRLTVVR